MKRAFTLIELLVVIAIIAILAAILFPVFAQAKAAAKKTAALAQIKQLNTGAALYEGDSDDVYPLAVMKTSAGWQWGKAVRTPSDWNGAWSAEEVAASDVLWANSMQPYMKSRELLHAPGQNVVPLPTIDYSNIRKTPESANFDFNGLLTEYNASSIAAPSQLIAFWQGLGLETYRGYAVTSPFLECDIADAPCKYIPTYASCDASQNGNWDYYFMKTNPSMWAYGKGGNVAMADGSAKFRRLGANVLGKTDYRSDPYSQYAADGSVPAAVGWYDAYACHAILFRPDFDFQDFGDPIEL